MGVVRVELPSELGEMIEREVAAGRAASVAAYVAEAVREYAGAEDEMASEAAAGIADIEAGRFVEFEDAARLRVWGEEMLERVRRDRAR